MYKNDGQEDRLRRIEQKLDELSKSGSVPARYFGYEYKSKKQIFGMPLVHIAQGIDPATGRPRVARGFIAIGNVAIGVFALGGVSLGVFSFGGMGLGIFAFGGLALGILLGMGGMAIGAVAIGGFAAGYIALGGAAYGIHAIGGNAQDPAALERLKQIMKIAGHYR